MRIKSRARRCIPRVVALEDRALLSGAAPLGINLDVNAYWGSTGEAWVDVKNMFGRWLTPDGSATFTTLTPDGYPLGDAESTAVLADYPDGEYQLSFRGRADVSFRGQGRLAGPIVTGADGISRGTVIFEHWRGPALYMKVANVDAADPFRDFHLIAPGYATDTTQVFTDEFLARLQPFSAIRTMNWTRTNSNPQAQWSDRVLPGDFIQTGDDDGVAWEYIIELANESRKDLWINVPHRADDDYVRRLAGLVRDRIRPDAEVYVEYSNEVWATGSIPYQYVLEQARANPVLTASDDWGRVAQQSALRLKQVGDIFRQEFGPARAGQVEPVFGAFSAGSYWASTALSFVNQTFGDPSRYFAAAAIAPYVEIAGGYDYPGQSMDGLFEGLNRNLRDTIAPRILANRAVADQYRLPLFAYEGGQGMSALNGVNAGLKMDAQNDPRMGRLYEDMMSAWGQDGGGLFMHYTFAGYYSNWGYWGLIQSMADPGSQKWDALMRLYRPGGDATLDGRVDYADFATLEANYQSTGRFWEQGDFNGDGAVNSADLKILRANASGLSPAQAVEVALFDAPESTPQGIAVTVNEGGQAGTLTYTWSATGAASGYASVTSGPPSSSAFVFTPNGPGAYTVSLTVRDASGSTANGSTIIETTGAPDAGPVQVVDDGDAGFAASGPWGAWGAGYRADHRFADLGDPATATWTFAAEPGAAYRISATWQALPYRAPDAPFEVLDGAATLATVRVDQRLGPDDRQDDGVGWEDLGTFTAAGSALAVRLSNAASAGQVVADAIRVERLPGAPDAGPVQVVDDGDAGFAASGPWGAWGAGYRADHRFADLGDPATATWTFAAEPGAAYRISATWQALPYRAPDAPFEVLDGAATLATVRVDQRLGPDDRQDDGVGWEDLGTFTATGATLAVRLSNAASAGQVVADAIRVERIDV